MPTLNRKIRVVADWTLALFFKREIVSLGSISMPFHEFEAAAGVVTATGAFDTHPAALRSASGSASGSGSAAKDVADGAQPSAAKDTAARSERPAR